METYRSSPIIGENCINITSLCEYKRRDEYIHGITNCKLFRQYISENPDIWDDELKFDIYEGMRELVSYEEALVDYITPTHIDPEKCKEYIKYQADQALKELGMQANYNIVHNPFPFMEEVTGTILTDFFSGKVTSYSRKMLGTREDLRDKIQAKLDTE